MAKFETSARPTFASVYHGCVDSVWRMLRRCGVPDSQVEDAVQDVFVVVHRRLGSFEGRSSVRTWVLGIAIRVAKDYRRSSRRKGTTEQMPASLEADNASPLEAAARLEGLALLDQLLGRLDEDKRTVLVLADIEQLTAPEISEALQVNVNTVYARLRAARAELNAAVARCRAREAG